MGKTYGLEESEDFGLDSEGLDSAGLDSDDLDSDVVVSFFAVFGDAFSSVFEVELPLEERE